LIAGLATASEATGRAIIALRGKKIQICWNFTSLKGIDKPTAAHIQVGAAGTSRNVSRLGSDPRLRAGPAKRCVSALRPVRDAWNLAPAMPPGVASGSYKGGVRCMHV
jgi:hypothetical protein